MTTQPPEPEAPVPDHELPVRAYVFLGAAGLLLLWLSLSSYYGTLALAPVLCGALGLAVFLPPRRWAARIAALQSTARGLPYAVLFFVIIIELALGAPMWPGDEIDVTGLLTAAGLVAYFAAQYRVIGLRATVMPVDPRPRPDRAADPPAPRPAAAVTRGEWITAGVVLPAAIIAAQALWWWTTIDTYWPAHMGDPPDRLGMPHTPWRLYSLAWLLGVGTLLLRSAAGLLATYRQTAAAARLHGQEVVWTETRGEQRRVNRWLAWVRRTRARQTGGRA